MAVTGCSVGPLGAGVPLLCGLKLLWAEAPYWPRASCLPYLLVDLHSWLPQVLQAQPLQVNHHQYRLDLPAQLRGTKQVRWSDGDAGHRDLGAAPTFLPPPPLAARSVCQADAPA